MAGFSKNIDEIHVENKKRFLDFNGFIEKENIIKLFTNLNNHIERFSSNSEHSFLKIGGKLQNYQSYTQKLTNDASQISSIISNEILKKGTDELNEQLKHISEYLNKSAKEIQNDKEVILYTFGQLGGLSDELSGFKRIVKRLRMLGISTKIESSRLNIEDDGFVSLADNVDSMGGIISEKIDIIDKKSDVLQKELSQTSVDLEKLEDEQREQTEIILNNSIRSLDELKHRRDISAQSMENISQRSKSVSQNISHIVSSIQFHDITRQQMEHIKETLNELSADIVNMNSLHEADTDEYGMVHDVCELQAVQLANSLEEFTKAVEDIIVNLKNVESNIGDIFTNSLESLCEKDKNNIGSLKVIEEELTAVISGLLKNMKISNELSVSIKGIIDIVEDLLKYVNEIEEVGDEIELIALNARIGYSGAALGVLAESIQRLSSEAKNQTSTTSKILFGLGNESKKLSVSLKTSSDNDEQNTVSKSIDKINDLLNAMTKIEKEADLMIADMKNDVQELTAEINETVDTILIHHEAKKHIQPIINNLHETANLLKENLDFSTDRKQHTKDLMKKYTMHTERKIHENFSNGESNLGVNQKEKNTDNGDALLDDNIELF